MPRKGQRTVSAEAVNAILNALAEKLSVQEVLKKTGCSTTTFYKIVAEFPLWSSHLNKDNPNA